eukprot:jgi/Chrzof1/14616/Cz09g09180.t1
MTPEEVVIELGMTQDVQQKPAPTQHGSGADHGAYGAGAAVSGMDWGSGARTCRGDLDLDADVEPINVREEDLEKAPDEDLLGLPDACLMQLERNPAGSKLVNSHTGESLSIADAHPMELGDEDPVSQQQRNNDAQQSPSSQIKHTTAHSLAPTGCCAVPITLNNHAAGRLADASGPVQPSQVLYNVIMRAPASDEDGTSPRIATYVPAGNSEVALVILDRSTGEAGGGHDNLSGMTGGYGGMGVGVMAPDAGSTGVGSTAAGGLGATDDLVAGLTDPQQRHLAYQ